MYFTTERTRIHENSPQAPRDAASAGALLHRAAHLGFRRHPPPTYKSWDGTSDVSWYNDTDTEFHLTTAEQLAGLAEVVNGGNTMAGKTIYLDADLDLAGHEWTSIGQDAMGAPTFSGTFDGQNHYIANLTSRKTDYARHGLFGDISDATLKNVNLLNADVYSANGFLVEGILADWADNSTVQNCYTSGRVESAAGNKLLGGLIGQCTAASQIIGCGSDAVVVSTYCEGEDCDTVGGLIGQWETSVDNSLISDCWFGGSVSCGYIDSAVGGILGANFDFGRPNVAIKNCLVTTKDIICAEPENVTWIAAVVENRIQNCYWPSSRADGNGNNVAVVRLIIQGNYAGADPDFDETQCGQPTDDFNSDDLIAALNANAYPGVVWQAGANHITFGWNAPTLPADYTEVDKALAEVNALDRSLYTDLSAVDAAVANVVRSCNALQQSDVNAMAQAIRDAVAALVLKGADYTAVDAAIAKADALNKDDYLDFTAVEAAISAVDRSKNITQQTEVDTMAQDIEAALAALQAKPTPAPTQEPTPAPTAEPIAAPTAAPTQAPAQQPAAPVQAASTATPAPAATPTAAPVVTATPAPAAATTIPATGDSTNIALLWVLMVVSGGVVWGIKRKKG